MGKISLMELQEELKSREKELTPLFKPGFLQRDHTVFQFEFDEGEPFYLTVTTNRFSLAAGRHDAPTLRLFIDDHATCWALIQGRLDGMQAFMEGRYRTDGHIVLSQLLLYLFKANDLTNIYQVQD
ncbi:MAG: SCP2 sterol-binding domain-containing protein [Pseudomonadales bacterium]|nr:SCP2 sterol-binding domain-containing protein [Pseudomonadales bacterium]